MLSIGTAISNNIIPNISPAYLAAIVVSKHIATLRSSYLSRELINQDSQYRRQTLSFDARLRVNHMKTCKIAYVAHFSMLFSSPSSYLHLKLHTHKAKALFVPMRVFDDKYSCYRSAIAAHEVASSFRRSIKCISVASMIPLSPRLITPTR
jgi:hypothetical protein